MIYNPSQIEEELLQVQRNVSPTEARTSLYNVVVFATDATRTEADKAVGHLLGRRPARVIQVRPARGGESDIRVSARCLLDENRQSVCIQEIVIDAAGRSAAPGLWSPLLIRDIPVYVLWLDTVADHVDDLLLVWEQADEIIVDSAAGLGAEPELAFASLLSAYDRQNLLFADLAWRRLTPFREAVATLFDTPAALPLLGELETVDFRGFGRSASILSAHWLASRLRWRPEDRMPSGLTFRDEGGKAVSVTWGSPDGATGAAFRTRGGDELTAAVDGSGCVHLDRPGQPVDTRVYVVPTIGEALMAELDDTKVDGVYLDTVSSLAR